MPVVGLAGVGIAGTLRRLDFLAQHRGPLVPAEQPALMQRHHHGKRLGFPRLAKNRPLGVARKAGHGLGRASRGGRIDGGHLYARRLEHLRKKNTPFSHRCERTADAIGVNHAVAYK